MMGDTASECGAGGATCLSCGTDRLCIDRICQVEPLPVGAKVAFITRTTFKGNLGGLSGADALCNAAAQAGMLPGRFKAWLSTNEWSSPRNMAVYVHAVDRFTSDGPWYLPGVSDTGRRELLFTNRAALRAAPRIPIAKNELGQGFSSAQLVFTGTEATGLSRSVSAFQSPQGTCSNWTSEFGTALVGSVFNSGGAWTSFGERDCSSAFPLYCFED